MVRQFAEYHLDCFHTTYYLEKNAQLEVALDKVKLLSGFLPICANCKNIRNDEGYWQDVVTYVREHSEADFTHGICPNCIRELYPEVYGDDDYS